MSERHDDLSELERAAAELEREPPELPGDLPGKGRVRTGGPTIGLSVPQRSAGRSTAVTKPALVPHAQKVLGVLDAALLRLLDGPVPSPTLVVVVAQLALMLRFRRTIREHLAQPPNDVVLAEGVIEYLDDVTACVQDFDAGGHPSAVRLVRCGRELCAEARAFQVEIGGLKNEFVELGQALAAENFSAKSDSVNALVQKAAILVRDVLRRLDAAAPLHGALSPFDILVDTLLNAERPSL